MKYWSEQIQRDFGSTQAGRLLRVVLRFLGSARYRIEWDVVETHEYKVTLPLANKK
jgi:hypothetical protein